MARAVVGHPRLAHIPALDGLRGLAVVAVLLFHGGWAGATGGFLGVDVFFVLSGFLITSLLLSEQRSTGTVALRRFWVRRVRRLAPPLLLVVVSVAAATPFFDPSAAVGLRGDGLAALAHVANWRFVVEGADYFGRTGAESPLNHLWSLAIEEQFYVVWPLVVLAVAGRRRAARWVGLVAAGGAAASIAAMVLLQRAGADPSRVYYGTDTRAHTVLVGAAVAALLARSGESLPTAALWPRCGRLVLGLTALVAGLVLVAAIALVEGGQAWLYGGGLPLFSLAAAMIIVQIVLIPEGLVARVLRLKPLGQLGRLSYGIYLWHWPLYLLLTAARTGLSGGGLLAVRLGATLALALASDRLLERPMRARHMRRRAWAGLAAPVAVGATVAVVLAATVGVPDRGFPQGAEDAGGTMSLVAQDPDGSTPPPPAAETVPARTRAPGEPVEALVLGDSVALTLAQGLAGRAQKAGIATSHAALLGCGVARGGPLRYGGRLQAEPPSCPTWPAHWSRALQAHDPDVVVVVVGRWEVVDRFWEGRWTHLGEADYDRYIEAELDHAVAVAGAQGARVALATAPYYSRGERPDGGRWPEDDPLRVDRLNELVRSVASRHPGLVNTIDLGGKTAKGGAYTRSLEGVQLRYDGVHLTPTGVRWLASWLLPQLEALGPEVVG